MTASTVACASLRICCSCSVPAKALCVDLVNVFGARRSCGKPAARGTDLDTADGRIVPGRAVDDAVDLFSGKLRGGDVMRATAPPVAASASRSP